ncbi:Flavin-linked sulfhydryl oxidase of the mitochondrial IMS [Hanseniaspora vineae]
MSAENTHDKNTTKHNQIGVTGRKIIYDEDGKPCRSCNTLLDFQMVTGKISSTAIPAHTSNTSAGPELKSASYKQDPPDVEELGKSTWTFLHSVAAKYPKAPNKEQQGDMKNFINIFSKLYPCSWCADDFKDYIAQNAPKVGSRDELGKWFCEAHNEVNVKLGKEKFDCNLWEKRWKDGWE